MSHPNADLDDSLCRIVAYIWNADTRQQARWSLSGDSPLEGFYTVAEFIRVYGVPRSSLYRLLKDPRNGLRIYKIGRASRIAKAEARAWADRLPSFGGEIAQ